MNVCQFRFAARLTQVGHLRVETMLVNIVILREND